MEYIWDLLVNLHWGAVGQIIMIDILLGGDNAVVIAMACRNLPHEQRAKGIFWGTAGAIALRVVLITFAVMLLDLPFLKAAGGLLLLWIGVKLLIPEFDSHEKIEGSSKLLGAIKTIIVADFVMSFDNVIAIAGAAQQAHEAHQTLLIIFGLVVSAREKASPSGEVAERQRWPEGFGSFPLIARLRRSLPARGHWDR